MADWPSRSRSAASAIASGWSAPTSISRAWTSLPSRALLFGEGQGRIVVSTADAARGPATRARSTASPARQIGTSAARRHRTAHRGIGATLRAALAVVAERTTKRFRESWPDRQPSFSHGRAEPAESSRVATRCFLRSDRLSCVALLAFSGHPDAVELTRLGLYSLQHRGQESAGIVVVDDDGQAHAIGRSGWSSDGLGDGRWTAEGPIAIGHTRYSTAGSTDDRERAARARAIPRRAHRPRAQRQHHQRQRAAHRARGARLDLQLDDGLRGARTPARDVDGRRRPRRSSPTPCRESKAPTAS